MGVESDSHAAWSKRAGELRAGGMSARDANRQAWAEVGGSRPSVGSEVRKSYQIPLVPSALFDGKRPVNARKRIEWVAQHLAADVVDPSECPDMGSWGLLVQSRDDPAWFWKDVYPKLLAKSSSELEGGMHMDDGASLDDLDDRILGALKGARAD